MMGSTRGVLRWGKKAWGVVAEVHSDATGLRLVESSHTEVANARTRLGQARKNSAQARVEVMTARSEVEALRAKAEAIDRIDPRFPALIQREHEALRAAAAYARQAEEAEELERIEFENLSAALERSHAQEREYAERTKWYSLSASVAGAVLGLFGSSLASRSRTQHLTNAVYMQGDDIIRHIDFALQEITLERDQSRAISRAPSTENDSHSHERGENPRTTTNREVDNDKQEPTETEPPTQQLPSGPSYETVLALSEDLHEKLEARTKELRYITVGGTLALATIMLLSLLTRTE